MRRAPLHSALTAAVLGIALALPAAFWVALESAERAAGGWTDGAARISLFLERDTGQAAVEARAAELAARPEIAGTETISPEQALATLRERSDFDAALELLDRNPLPPVIVARVSGERDPGAVAALAERLAEAPYVERMRLDQQWLERLHALVALAERALGVLTALLAVAVVLVVGNTIRLTIESRREEIGIVKLIGGSDGFVRRPFLYEGLGYGLAGGALAWALAEAVAEPLVE
ncbi:permease-like cell division protein FtsX, partial [Halorhodospira neutriphila]|uniref:permease-like cell division protein FtsX n=1 Tax=Halorhodospira neutriphila TaxID=168379 RepID=UPI00237C240B